MRRTVLVTIVAAAVLSVSGGIGESSAVSAGLHESHAPRIPGPAPLAVHASSMSNWSSTNWSGYAQTGSGINSASGSWTVPTVSTPKAKHARLFSSTWVGIDGFNNSSLIQAGTEQDWVNGAPFYQAWWEILPAAETPIPSLVIHPGNSISVSIVKGVSEWTITVTDATTGQSFSTQQAYSGPLNSVEWIQEAPTIGRHVAKLAPGTTVVFDAGTVSGASPGLLSSQSGTMFRGRKVISTPSLPDLDVTPDGFAVAYGAVAPPPPNS